LRWGQIPVSIGKEMGGMSRRRHVQRDRGDFRQRAPNLNPNLIARNKLECGSISPQMKIRCTGNEGGQCWSREGGIYRCRVDEVSKRRARMRFFSP